MSLGVVIPEHGPTSPSSSHNSPSPPATVPVVRKIVPTTAQKRDEEFAFANFLCLEEQRIRKAFPKLPYSQIQNRIVTKWTQMKPFQRLKYLEQNKEPDENERKINLKRKLDEQLDSHLQIGLNPPTVPSPPKLTLLPNFISEVKKTPNPILAGLLGLPVMQSTETQPPQQKPYIVRKPMDPNQADHIAARKEALDLFYLACCAPAFPHPGEEPLTQHSANYYFGEYQRLSRL